MLRFECKINFRIRALFNFITEMVHKEGFFLTQVLILLRGKLSKRLFESSKYDAFEHAVRMHDARNITKVISIPNCINVSALASEFKTAAIFGIT